MSDTGWNVTIEFADGREPVRISSPIASLPMAIGEAARAAGLGSAFSGSFQLTVTSGQLEPAGSASEPDGGQPDQPDQPDVYERIGLTGDGA